MNIELLFWQSSQIILEVTVKIIKCTRYKSVQSRCAVKVKPHRSVMGGKAQTTQATTTYSVTTWHIFKFQCRTAEEGKHGVEARRRKLHFGTSIGVQSVSETILS